MLAAAPHQRPDLLSVDAGGLLDVHPGVVPADGGGWRCGAWWARPDPERGHLQLGRTGGESEREADGLDALRALCVAHWTREPDGSAPARVRALGAPAAAALSRWQLSD
nr:hypothetical protein [Geodermatophilus sabuli]